MQKLIYLFILAFFGLALLNSCESDTFQYIAPVLPPAPPSDGKYHTPFSTQVYPILQNRCLTCHGAAASGGLNLTGSAAGVYLVVDKSPYVTSSSSTSLLYLKPAGLTTHGGGTVYKGSEADTVKSWIDGGARY